MPDEPEHPAIESYRKKVIAGDAIVSALTTRTLDFMKHLTTLSSAVVVFIVTFRDKVATAEWAGLVPAAIVSFLVCILFAMTVLDRLIALETTVRLLRNGLERGDADGLKTALKQDDKLSPMANILSVVGRIPGLSFSVGIVLLGTFVIRNFV